MIFFAPTHPHIGLRALLRGAVVDVLHNTAFVSAITLQSAGIRCKEREAEASFVYDT